MRKYLTLGIVALFLISLSGCQFNLFTEFDKIEIPSAAEMSSKADSNPDGFLDDVNDYIESDSITEDDADGIIDALEIIYLDGGNSPEVQEKAAVFAGKLIIDYDPAASSVVNGILGTVTDVLDSGGTVTPETIIADVFPSNLSLVGLQSILNVFDQAADAYSVLDNDGDGVVDSGGDWMSDSEVGDMTFYAITSLVISDLRGQLTAAVPVPYLDVTAAEQDLLDFIVTGGSDSLDANVNNPFDTTDGPVTEFENDLTAILALANLEQLGL